VETSSSDITRPVRNETVEPPSEARVEVEFVRFPVGYNLCVSTDFLDRLASQLRAIKSAACRRAIQRILAVAKKNFEEGKYKNDVEAEADFRHLVERDKGCK